MAVKLAKSSTVTLHNGVKMPALGFGVYNSPTAVCTKSCLTAFKVGYRHIDTAQFYGNEDTVGAAVSSPSSGLSRKDVFVTTKIIRPGTTAAGTDKKLYESISEIGGDGSKGEAYVDAFLIHTPNMGKSARKDVWTALEKLLEAGKAKSIGVSNYGIPLLEEMKEYAKVWPPHINQIELHPWCQQRELVKYCEDNNIVIQAYSPLLRNRKADDPTLNKVAKTYDKTTSQILIRYSLQKGWAPLPKSDTPERIEANADVFDFDISADDMSTLDNLDQGARGAIVMVGKDR